MEVFCGWKTQLRPGINSRSPPWTKCGLIQAITGNWRDPVGLLSLITQPTNNCIS
ncbi:hypothetical protein CRC_02604 [Cylindrospermopsis raciborskii CS-505]|nr:hypothetical protein CRC_02604 [Cylindrospermopsis raciborskii CS-505]